MGKFRGARDSRRDITYYSDDSRVRALAHLRVRHDFNGFLREFSRYMGMCVCTCVFRVRRRTDLYSHVLLQTHILATNKFLWMYDTIKQKKIEFPKRFSADR